MQLHRLKKWAPWILAVGFVAFAAIAGPALSSGSGIMTTISSVYVNNVPGTFIYGGGQLPSSRGVTISAIRFLVRTAGSGGTTNATFRIDDGTNQCDCSYACNQSVSGFGTRVACSGSAGTGCTFAASAALRYRFSGVGDCSTTSADIMSNLDIEGVWQ